MNGFEISRFTFDPVVSPGGDSTVVFRVIDPLKRALGPGDGVVARFDTRAEAQDWCLAQQSPNE